MDFFNNLIVAIRPEKSFNTESPFEEIFAP